MFNKEIAFVATRILALYILAGSIINVSPAVVWLAWEGNPNDVVLALTIAPLAVQIIMAALLWFLAGMISRKMVDGSPNSEQMTPFDWWGLGFALVGLFAIFSSLPELVSAAVSKGSGIAALISGLLKMSLGVYLVFGWKGLVGLLIRTREFGRKPEGT